MKRILLVVLCAVSLSIGAFSCGGSGGGSGSLVSIAVTPANPSMAVGATKQFTATGTYSDGTTEDITTSVTWSSSALSVATIDSSSGLATAVANGTATISAIESAILGNTTLTVGGSSTKTTLVSGEINISAIAVDATSVYWAEAQDGQTSPYTGTMSIKKVGLDGGTITTLAENTGPNYVSTRSVAVDSTRVYWTENDQLQERVKVVGIGGRPAALLDPDGSLFLAIDASNIYFTDEQAPHTSSVKKMAKSGGGATEIASGLEQPYNIVVNSMSAFWVDRWDGDGTIYSVPLGGGGAASLVVVPFIWNCEQSIAVDESNVYWVDNLGGTVNKMSTAGGPVTVLASGQSLPCAITVDGSNVYWSDTAFGLYKVGLDGGAITTILPSPDEAIYLSLYSTYLYWTDGSGIYKIAK